MENVIKINGADYKVKNTLRAIFIYEEITGTSFKVETTRDNYLYFYSILLANNPDKVISWDDFIDAIDSDPGIMDQLNALLKASAEVDELLRGESDGDDKKKG